MPFQIASGESKELRESIGNSMLIRNAGQRERLNVETTESRAPVLGVPAFGEPDYPRPGAPQFRRVRCQEFCVHFWMGGVPSLALGVRYPKSLPNSRQRDYEVD